MAVTGIRLREPAVNSIIHNNLVRNCGIGLESIAARSVVKEIVDATTFDAGYGLVPLGWQPHLYSGWTLVWFRGGKLIGSSEIDSFEPLASRFKLKQPGEIKVGDTFEIRADAANWNIHDNTITGCLTPIILNSAGSATSFLKGNLISRGDATGAKQAIQIMRGEFQTEGNLINGFDEEK